MRASQTPESWDVPGLRCALLLRTEPATLRLVQGSLPLTPYPVACTLTPGFEASWWWHLPFSIQSVVHPRFLLPWSTFLPGMYLSLLGSLNVHCCLTHGSSLGTTLYLACPAVFVPSAGPAFQHSICCMIVPDPISYFLSMLCFYHALLLLQSSKK